MINPIQSQSPLPIKQPLSDVNSLQQASGKSQDEMQDVFREFVGQTFFGQMMSAMHKTHDQAAYFHGGRAEEIFQQQLDQVYVEELTESSAGKIADPMYHLFNLSRK